MKIFKLTFLFLSLCFVPLLTSDEKEIRIHLHTQERLTPVYVSKWFMQETHLGADYLKQLHAVLHFDLSNNGFSKVVHANEQFEKMLSHHDMQAAFNGEFWKNSFVLHVIKLCAVQKRLDAYVYSTQTGELKMFKNITLTGDLSIDRLQMHKLADGIQRSLFNIEGVAHSRILYSVQPKNAFSPDKSWKSEIWECDWDGGNAKQVTFENSYCITPAQFSTLKPSDRFVYVSYKNGQPKIHLGSFSKKMEQALISLRGNQLLPAISPQLDQIAFICDASGRADLFIQKLNADGTASGKPGQIFSMPQATQASPTFSPDGTKLAFVSDKDGSPRIYVISTIAKNKQPSLITKANRENICPSWSPDGKKIVYSAKTGSERQIWIYSFDTKEEKQLTYGPGNKENPSWAPDSLHIVFNSTDPTSSELYVVNLNQPEAIKISRGPGVKHYPSWGKR